MDAMARPRRKHRHRSTWFAAAGLALAGGGWIVACALQTPPVDQVLHSRPTAEPTTDPATSLLLQLDRRAADARRAAQAAPDDIAAAVAAAQALFFAADLRLQHGILAHEAAGDGTPAALIGAEDELPDTLRAEVLSLCEAGLAFSERAVELDGDRVQTRLYLALHLSLAAWGRGAMRSLLQGLGPRIAAAIDKAIELDAAYSEAAPLRLRGRFLTRAPWPIRDLDEAKTALERAVELAANPVNHLFLGDTLWLLEEHDAAKVQWRAATTAKTSADALPAADAFRELARLRIAAAGG